MGRFAQSGFKQCFKCILYPSVLQYCCLFRVNDGFPFTLKTLLFVEKLIVTTADVYRWLTAPRVFVILDTIWTIVFMVRYNMV